MMRLFLTLVLLVSGLIPAQAQTDSSLDEIEQRWADVTIRDVNDDSLPTMLRAFDRTWHTAAGSDALDMVAKGNAQGMHHEESGYSGLYDVRNGYIEVFFDDETCETLQACCRRRADGHSLLVVMLGSHAGFDKELLLSYDYDPQACRLTPDEKAIDGLPKVTDLNMMRIHELPQTGDELEVIEYYGDDVTEYRFAWDGSKFGLSKKNIQCYDCVPVEIEGEYYIQVPFEGAEPTIADFVDIYFSNGDVLPEMLGDIRSAWHRYRMNKTLPSHTTFLLDKNSGYMRNERKWQDGNLSVAEMCYWNCTDRRHKVVAQSIASYEEGTFRCWQYDGYSFSLYDSETRSMKQVELSDISVGDVSLFDCSNTVMQLPRTGKDIIAKKYSETGVDTEVLRWTGNKFRTKGNKILNVKPNN